SHRWLKVVNFGVNNDVTLVTEVTAFYHESIAPGAERKGNENLYVFATSLSASPVRHLTVGYTGNYNDQQQDFAQTPSVHTRTIEHLFSAQYDITRSVDVRGQYMNRDVQ